MYNVVLAKSLEIVIKLSYLILALVYIWLLGKLNYAFQTWLLGKQCVMCSSA